MMRGEALWAGAGLFLHADRAAQACRLRGFSLRSLLDAGLRWVLAWGSYFAEPGGVGLWA